MVNKQIIDYVQRSLEGGYSVEQINSALAMQGWNQTEINEALLKAQEIIQQKSIKLVVPPAPPKNSEWNIELKSLSASQILLYLGGLIVVLAGTIYIGINWSQWGSMARIFAILLPILICYGVGSPMFFSNEHKKQSIVFLVVGSLLFPFFLSIIFKELEIFPKPFSNNFNLTISFLSFILYLVSSFIFRFPIWAFLYQAAGLFVYYFFLGLIGIENFFEKPAIAWLFLIPGTVYLLLSLFYDKNERKDEGNYSYTIGASVLVLSFIRLFGETFSYNKEHLAYLLFFFGVAYFLLGIFYEKINFKKYCEAPYFIGAGIVFFSLFRLAINGTLLKDFTGNMTINDHNIIGWSNIVVGLIYLVFAYIVEKLKNIQLEEAPKYKEFFNLVGPFFVLGAIFYLGLDGKKPIYETLLLLSSLGFIFGSIPKLARQYLLVGTLFLIIYIFSIGGEYFQNEVGWPITLFVAGLASMGISIVMEKVRRKYFTVAKV
ncbi:MAG TPA: hypothetical protein PLD14_00535 [Candidatus Pacearchaeota archaeon]|nr:hypothetical protein [Candidatus Pacearchaeota archaeon]HPR79699.1 hypothetical protein [Candidatus Pacearchaeota archaeon]